MLSIKPITFSFIWMALAVGAAAEAPNVTTRVLAESKPGFYAARATYVELGLPTSIHRLATKWSRESSQSGFQSFLRGTKSYFGSPSTKESLRASGGKPPAPYSCLSNTVASLADAELVALFVETTVYSGGAQRRTMSVCANFGRVRNQAVRLKLTDVLRSARLKSDIRELLMPAIMERKRSLDPDAAEPDLGDVWQTNWLVTPSGITWVFDQGLIGAEAEGRFVVKVPWDRLSALIPIDGPLGRFRASSNDFLGTWELVRYDGMDDTSVLMDMPEDYSLTLRADGLFSGKVDLNRIQGTYARKGASLTFTVKLTTKALPPPGSYHDKFIANLGFVRSYVMKANELHLSLMADGGIMTFRRSGTGR